MKSKLHTWFKYCRNHWCPQKCFYGDKVSRWITFW